MTVELLDKTHRLEYRKARLECLRFFPENFGSTYEEEVLKDELFFERQLKDPARDNFIFGAWDEQNCIGLCGFVRETRERTRHRGEVIQMYVHPDHQKKGIGKRLLDCVVEKAFQTEGIEQVILSVMSSNVNANKFYEQSGFIEYGKLKNCFKIRTGYLDQIFMVRNK